MGYLVTRQPTKNNKIITSRNQQFAPSPPETNYPNRTRLYTTLLVVSTHNKFDLLLCQSRTDWSGMEERTCSKCRCNRPMKTSSQLALLKSAAWRLTTSSGLPLTKIRENPMKMLAMPIANLLFQMIRKLASSRLFKLVTSRQRISRNELTSREKLNE